MKSTKSMEIAALRVAPEKFTWMRYRGEKVKILTHTKRNGDKVRARLEPNDVFGYRATTHKATGKKLTQIVLKSDGMDLAYNLLEVTFNKTILKVSKASVMPKKFQKPIDIKAIDKNPKVKTVKDATNPKPKGKSMKTSAPNIFSLESRDFKNTALNAIDRLEINPNTVATLNSAIGYLEVNKASVKTGGTYTVNAVLRNFLGSKNEILDNIDNSSSKIFHAVKNIESEITFGIGKALGNTNMDLRKNVIWMPKTQTLRVTKDAKGERILTIGLAEIYLEGLGVPQTDPVSKPTTVKKSLGNPLLDTLNGWGVSDKVAKVVRADSANLEVRLGKSPKEAPRLYVVFKGSHITPLSQVKERILDKTRTGLYNSIIVESIQTSKVASKHHPNIDAQVYTENAGTMVTTRNRGTELIVFLGYLSVVTDEDREQILLQESEEDRDIEAQELPNVEFVVAEVLNGFRGDSNYGITVDANYPAHTAYSVSVSYESKRRSVLQVRDAIMNKIGAIYGTPEILESKTSDKSNYAYTISKTLQVGGVKFKTRSRFTKDGPTFYMVFFECIFDR